MHFVFVTKYRKKIIDNAMFEVIKDVIEREMTKVGCDVVEINVGDVGIDTASKYIEGQ